MDYKPWETKEGKEVWKSKAQYFTWLRGALRRIWSDYPLRKVWKKGSLRPVTKEERQQKKYHPSTKNVGQCVFCLEWMAGSKLECDHIKPSEGCYDFSTAKEFLLHCGAQTSINFQLACKPCHKIETLANAKGISFEEAKIEKQVIAWLKENKGVVNQRKLLSEMGIEGVDKVKATEVRQVYFDYLKKNS